MKVALFSTQNFERPFFVHANKKFRHELLFHKEELHQETAPMAAGFPAVCAFINDKLDAVTLSALVAGGTRFVALRSAGYNNVDLPAADKLKITLMRVPAYAPAAIAEYAVVVPWLIALACALFRAPPAGSAAAVLLWLCYVWTDWPINYAGFGMVPYFLAVPVTIVGLGAFARFLERGGALNWWLATVAVSLSFLVHFTSLMVLAPGAALAYLAAAHRPRTDGENAHAIGNDSPDRADQPPVRRLSRLGHAAVWLMPVVVLAVNAFWWLPGIWLASTKGDSTFAFSHSKEELVNRLLQIEWSEAPMEAILLATGLPGLFLLFRRDRIVGCGALGFRGRGDVLGLLSRRLAGARFLAAGASHLRVLHGTRGRQRRVDCRVLPPPSGGQRGHRSPR